MWSRTHSQATCTGERLSLSLSKLTILIPPSTFSRNPSSLSHLLSSGKVSKACKRREPRSGFNVPMHQLVSSRQVYVKSKTIDWSRKKWSISRQQIFALSPADTPLRALLSIYSSCHPLTSFASETQAHLLLDAHLYLSLFFFSNIYYPITIHHAETIFIYLFLTNRLSSPLTKLSSLSMLELSLFKM